MLAVSIVSLFFILLFFAVPLTVTLIYRFFYDNHVNKSLQAGLPVKRWFPPFALFMTLLLLELLLLIGSSMLYIYNPNSDVNIMDRLDYSYASPADMDPALLSAIEAGDSGSYVSEDRSQGNYSCQVYAYTGDQLLPTYIIRFSYTGPEDLGCWDAKIHLGSTGGGVMANFQDPSDKTIYLILGSSMSDAASLEIDFNAYPGTMETYDTDALGTYNMPENAETLSLTLR